MKRFKKFISLFLTMVMLLSVYSIVITVSATVAGTNTTEETPLKIEIETDTKNPSVYSVVGFTVKITNTGDEDLTNVTAQTVFDDLSPVNNRKSETTKEVETLKAGESFSYSYKATLNMNNPDLHFFNRLILWFVRLFNGGYNVENTNIDDGRTVIENITEFSFGGVTAENIVVLRYKRAEIEIVQAEMTDSQKELLKIAELNGGTLPDITKSTSTGVPTFIDGKYSDKIVTDYKSAIDSLNDIKHLMNIDNPDSEFILQQERKTSNGKNQYKLQQVYNTIPVYGSELTITVDNDGNVDCLNGQYNPQIRKQHISISPRISKSEVENELEKQEYKVVTNKGLIIYATEGYKPQLAYEVNCRGMITLFISAENGHIISSESSQRTFSATGNDMYGENRSFEVLKKKDNLYMLIDEKRGITVYNNNNKTTEKEKDNFTKHTEYLTHCEIITSQNNTWSDESVQAMYAVQKSVDFYKNIVHTTAFDNQLTEINVAINYMSGYLNAFSDTDLYNSATYLCIGDGIEFLKGYDVIAHEFTHSIISATCDFKYLNQSGALDEAYADILGNIIEGGDDWTIGEDIAGSKLRSLEKPNDYNLPSKVNDKYMADYCYEDHNHYKAKCDNGGVHTNCSIVSHAAYLMWKNGISDKIKLAQLFVTSLEYMNSTSNFLDCRAAVLKSAKELNMSSEEINIIKEAFSEVGIGEDDDGFSWITGTVKGKLININTGEPIVDTRIFACTKEGYNGAIVGGGYFYPDENGDFSAQLYGGIYTFFISPQNDIDNKSNYDEYCIKEIKVKSWKTNDLGTIFLFPKNENDDTNDDSGNSGDNFDDEINTYKSISFTVTDEITDKPIENVVVEVTEQGESLTNVITTATTDKNGRFTVELPEGEYSFLLTHDDYYQSFVPITVNSETADATLYLTPMENSGGEDDDRTVIDSGDCGADGDNVKWTLYDDGELVISGSGKISDLAKASETPWYSKRKKIKEISFSAGITKIGNNAFAYCDNLIKVSMSDSIISIGDYAFDSCDNLNDIDFGNGIKTIGDGAFYSCDNLVKVDIPDSVTTIGDIAFAYCDNLTNIFIPDSVTKIGFRAFEYSGYYSNTDNWENDVLYIDNHLIEANGISGEYIIKLGTRTIADYAFAYSSLDNIIMPNSIIAIGHMAFGGHMTQIQIPSSVEIIYSDAFYCCSNITNFVVDNNNKYFCNDLNGVLYNKDKTELIQYPIGNEMTEFVIPDSVKKIGNSAFSWCNKLRSVTFGDNVNLIGDYAFSMCDELTSVIMSSSVSTIGKGAFHSCKKLVTITIPNSVKTIGDEAFAYCYKITSVTIPNGITIIGYNAFENCPALNKIIVKENNQNYSSDSYGVLYNKDKTELIQYPIGNERTEFVIPDTVITIEDWSFAYCNKLTTLTISNNVIAIKDSAFRGCDKLTDVTIGAGVITIEGSAFLYCDSLAKIEVNSNNQYYSGDSYGVLYNKDKTELIQYPIGNERTTFTIPSSVTKIKDDAFNCCNNLIDIKIPNSVKKIGNSAFSWCDNLTNVYFTGTAEQWNNISIGYSNGYLTGATIHYNS